MIGHYRTARAFRAALEDRLKQMSQSRGVDLMRLRRQVAFDRMLGRLFAEPAPPWTLKGGYSLELRLSAARATKDLDISIPSLSQLETDHANQSPYAAIRDALQDATERDLQDGFIFRIGEALAELDAAPEGGARYPIEARLDARVFAAFHVDVGIGDTIVAPPEWLIGHDMLSFAGISPVRVAALAREQQFAEKVHAYSLPRGARANTRVKNLVDLLLLLDLGMPDAERVRRALRATFARRNTHALPDALEPPPASWRLPYAALASDCHLATPEIDAAFSQVTTYYQQVMTLQPDEGAD